MTTRKRYIPLLLFISLFLALTFSGFAYAAGFSDTQNHWAEKEINKWADSGLAGGYSDGTFQPNGKVTRAEFVALVNRAFGIEKKTGASAFSDVDSKAWFYNDVCAAKAAGYTGGYEDGTFKPNKTITRQEVAGILTRLLNLEQSPGGVNTFKDSNQIPQWSSASIAAVVNNNLMGGFPDNTFKPLKSITRAEAVVSLDRAMQFDPSGTPQKDEPVIETAIQGKITLDGTPVKAAVVRIFKADSYEVLTQTLTNSNGIYNVKLDPGNYDISVSTNEAVNYKSDVKLTDNTVTEVDLSLKPAAVLTGKIEDDKGNGIEDASVFYTTNPTFVAYTGENGSYEIPVLPDRSYDVRVRESGDDEENTTLVAEKVKVTSPGKKSIETFELSSSESGSSGPSGGSGTSSETALKFTYASVTAGGKTFEADLTNDGLRGTVDLSNQPDSSKITKGTVTVSNDATLQMELTSVPEEYRDLIPSLMSTTQKLKKGEPTTIEAFDILGSGISLSLLKTVLEQNFMTLEGTLKDSNGSSNVSLTIKLP